MPTVIISSATVIMSDVKLTGTVDGVSVTTHVDKGELDRLGSDAERQTHCAQCLLAAAASAYPNVTGTVLL